MKKISKKKPEHQASLKEKPEIYRYHDYRMFLKDWLPYLKRSQSSFSLRRLTQEVGLSASNLSMILSGTRKCSNKTLERLGPALKLNSSEREYLRLLIILGDSDSPEARVEAFDKMKRFRQFKNLNPKDVEVFRYLTHWYYPAIREMSALPGFSTDPQWIQSHLLYPVEIREIENALKFLIENKYIEVKGNGKASSPEISLDCSGGIYRLALSQFHREMLDLAIKSIEKIPSDKRDIRGYTLSIRSEDFEKIQGILKRAYDEIQVLAEGKGNQVYHVELALFPLTKPDGSTNE